MSRYVDIEGDWVDDAVKAYSLGYCDDDEYAIPFEALGSAPSIDICFCWECEYGEYRVDFDDYECHASGCGLVHDAEFYCADGRRKNDE